MTIQGRSHKATTQHFLRLPADGTRRQARHFPAAAAYRSGPAAFHEPAPDEQSATEATPVERVTIGQLAVAPGPLVRGRHYLEQASAIEALRLRGELAEALSLALECVDASERDLDYRGGQDARPGGRRKAPNPAVTWQAARICRDSGSLVTEIELVERWLAQDAGLPEDASVSAQMNWRLATAKELLRLPVHRV